MSFPVPAHRPSSLSVRSSHSALEERELLLAAKADLPGARARLVNGLLPSINLVASAYSSAERAKLTRLGAAGLLAALACYDPAADASFREFARVRVREAMRQDAPEPAASRADDAGPLFVTEARDREFRESTATAGAPHRRRTA